MSDTTSTAPRVKNVWVVRHRSRWAVRLEDDVAPLLVFNIQYHALYAARKMARLRKCELIIQNERGQIRAKDSHGNDPRSTRG